MPVETEGRLENDIQFDQPRKDRAGKGDRRVEKKPEKRTKLCAPEEFILELADKDLEELY